MVTSPKGLGPKKDYAGEGQQHTKIDPSSRQTGRPQKPDRNCQRLISIWGLPNQEFTNYCLVTRETRESIEEVASQNLRLGDG
jgi:hypothetical protein